MFFFLDNVHIDNIDAKIPIRDLMIKRKKTKVIRKKYDILFFLIEAEKDSDEKARETLNAVPEMESYGYA